MKIRQATKNDIDAISDLLISLSRKFIVSDFSEEGVNNILHSMQPKAITWYFEKGYLYHVGVCGEQDKIVGVVATRDNCHLYYLFVAESEQGKGYARQLWEVAKQCCIDSGHDGDFTVNASLNAQAVYLAWGFKPIDGIREGGGVKDVPMRLSRKLHSI